MVINHLEKLFVTNDAATILRELEVQHPAAKMLVLAAQQQEQECGDGTNFVLVFAGALLENAEELIRMVSCGHNRDFDAHEKCLSLIVMISIDIGQFICQC